MNILSNKIENGVSRQHRPHNSITPIGVLTYIYIWVIQILVLLYLGISVLGKKGRKQIRYLLLQEKLSGDKKAIYEEYGYTPHRLRFRAIGEVTERWKYYSRGLEFTFDDESNLISTRNFLPQSGHIDWCKQTRGSPPQPLSCDLCQAKVDHHLEEWLRGSFSKRASFFMWKLY